MARVYNFSAGPAVLPEDVLKKAASEMLEYGTTGTSVMEMSHRSKDYMDLFYKAQNDLRKLMEIPDNYEVLFLQGGASLQFSMIPMNLAVKSKKMDYVNTGVWSKKAIAEAKKFGEVNIVASSEDTTFNRIPELDKAKFNKDADYFYLVSNNTIYGTRIVDFPDTGNVPLIADMSSDILSRKVDVSKFGIIFAGAQKNIGPSGLTVVIIRKDLIGLADDSIPTMLNYRTHSEGESMFNTPPTYSAYIAGLVFEKLLNEGGLDTMESVNKKKAALLYDFLDNSKLFKPTVEPAYRSIMNVPFVTGDDQKNADFIAQATKAGFVNLKGHRSVGGMRASIYNAMPIEGVQKLVEFMKAFEQNNA
ncbi:MAG: 3-phosphoserine/phosphohydroxythreonine transaminase [Spirochaetes bacterium]|nr:3-phosphoserine/phosphohydroxythreonine transaminase [Spirochaetota bacterium]MBN2771159.1 3-phosphoserine/phosphohydroxythreonine transaminase [Spirochaetota bacterium]